MPHNWADREAQAVVVVAVAAAEIAVDIGIAQHSEALVEVGRIAAAVVDWFGACFGDRKESVLWRVA